MREEVAARVAARSPVSAGSDRRRQLKKVRSGRIKNKSSAMMELYEVRMSSR